MTDPSIAKSEVKAIRLKLFGRTDVGQIREHNEDNFLIADLTRPSRSLREEDREGVVGPKGNAFGVCDGMGGAAAGEVASQMAVDLIYDKLVDAETPDTRDQLARNMVEAIEEAGLKIFSEARSDRSRRGMGTTSTIAALLDDRLFLGQVGDSRGYILRGDQLVQVTRDQSLVNQLIEAGQLTEEEAETFEHNNIILQALGTSDTVHVDLTYVDLKRNDTLLLCSDGLSGMIRDSEIRDALLRHREPMDACKELTELANAAGGHDNITVILVQFSGEGLDPSSADDVELKYRKYELHRQDPMRSTTRGGTPGLSDVKTPPPSEEARRETRDLRVSHTMIGSLSPEVVAAAQNAGGSDNHGSEDKLEVPTVGLPPGLVGLLVVLVLLLVAAVGFFFLR